MVAHVKTDTRGISLLCILWKVKMTRRSLHRSLVTFVQTLFCFTALLYTRPSYLRNVNMDTTPEIRPRYHGKFFNGLDIDSNIRTTPQSLNSTDFVSDDTGVASDQDSDGILMQGNPTKFNGDESGPIIRVQHLVPANQGQDKCKVFGMGLHRAKVGVIANVIIKFNKTCTRGQELNGTSAFSVLGVGKNHIFVAYPSPGPQNSTYMKFSYLPSYPGEYDLYVEDVVPRGQWQVPGSPFRLKIDGVLMEKPSLTKKFPSCQSLRLPRRDLSWVKGVWLTRKLARKGQDVLRSGWVHQPETCNFDVFTKDEILTAATSPTPKTIAVLGTSTERGIFLSLVDVSLKKEEKTDMETSDLGSCWGFAELHLGNLTYIYQDFRINRANTTVVRDDKTIMITCHNEKKADEGYKFWDDAMAFLRDFLFGDRAWPDIVVLPLDNKMQLRLIIKALPKSWNGTLYILSGFKTYRASLFTAQGRHHEIERAKEYPTLDPRVQVLDGFTLSAGMRHATESSPLIMGSMHWHRWCNELDGEMRVCGNPTEMVAQLILGKLIAPDGKESWLRSITNNHFQNTSSPSLRKVYVCHDCPKTLLPFHIKRHPDLRCYKLTDGLRQRSEENVRVWDGSLCPAKCLKTTPVGKAYTQSGMVDVRQCHIRV